MLIIFLFCLFLGSHRFARLPLLMVLSVLLALDFALYVGVRVVVMIIEMLLTARLFRRRSLHRKMKRAKSYAEWCSYAEKLDEIERRQDWKDTEADRNYHPRVVRAAVDKLRAARLSGDLRGLVNVIRPCLVKNFGGIMNFEMYTQAHCGTKKLIEEFITELEASLLHLTDQARVAFAENEDEDEAASPGDRFDEQGLQRLEQQTLLWDFARTSVQAYGRTSLLLSGGAALGFYHLGILRALLAEGLLPTVLCGTSMGSIVLSFLASRTDEEALQELREMEALYHQCGPEGGPMYGSKLWKMGQILQRGYIYEIEDMAKHLEWFTQGMTFQEAYNKTGRAINITCTPRKTTAVHGLPPLLLNHITAPHVTITSAVLASSCVPCLIPAVPLMERCPDGTLRHYEGVQGHAGEAGRESLDMVSMRDGSFESDVPVQAMGCFFNCHFNIVSQVNPHIVPFFFNSKGAIGRPIRWPWVRHRGGFLASVIECWCKEDMLKLLRVMKTTGTLFSIFGVDWGYLFLQEQQGDITIVPNATVYDFWRMVDNIGSMQELEDKLRKSERATWRHFAIIRNRMRIEKALGALETAVLGPEGSDGLGSLGGRGWGRGANTPAVRQKREATESGPGEGTIRRRNQVAAIAAAARLTRAKGPPA